MDILIVGAGPAGATAALTLARAGARVRVVDRARFPRHKPCGGAISMRVLHRFPYLRSAIERISTRRISRLHLEGPGGKSVDLETATPAALMIRRVEFDALLVALAREAGAEISEGVEITQAREMPYGVELATRTGERLAARHVIAADGANSVVAKRLGINSVWPRTSVALDMMEETPFERLRCADPDALWVAYGYRKTHGYAYVFPKRDHVNVGVGFVLDHYRRAIREAPYDVQRRFVGALCAEGILSGASDRRHFTPALVPVGGPLETKVTRRVTLIGDAGGFVNGITAEGIYYAMVSGDLAARAMLAGDPAAFHPLWRNELGAELRDAVAIQRFLFADPGRVDRLVDGAHRYRSIASLIVAYAMGDVSYIGARARFAATFPLLTLRIAASAAGHRLYHRRHADGG